MPTVKVYTTPLDRWQTVKGLIIIGILIVAFLVTPWPREVLALVAAGILLLSRKMSSREILGQVDWHLLTLFASLFIVNHALSSSGMLEQGVLNVKNAGLDLMHPAWLFGGTVVLSNLVSNVPAVMLLLPLAHSPGDGPLLALSSTLAGNLFIVGSIANLIVIDQAAQLGIRIGWRDHLRVGAPVTFATLLLAAGWLWLLR